MRISINDLQQCGVINNGGVVDPIYFNPIEGSFIYFDSFNSDWFYISELCAKSVNEVNNDSMTKMLLDGNFGEKATGVIMTADIAYVLEDDIAHQRQYSDLRTNIGTPITVSLDEAFESEVIEE